VSLTAAETQLLPDECPPEGEARIAWIERSMRQSEAKQRLAAAEAGEQLAREVADGTGCLLKDWVECAAYLRGFHDEVCGCSGDVCDVGAVLAEVEAATAAAEAARDRLLQDNADLVAQVKNGAISKKTRARHVVAVDRLDAQLRRFVRASFVVRRWKDVDIRLREVPVRPRTRTTTLLLI
jgi:hypothetical protein